MQNQQCAIGSEISHIKCCNWSSQQCNKASGNLIQENAVAANFLILGNLADGSARDLVSEQISVFADHYDAYHWIPVAYPGL